MAGGGKLQVRHAGRPVVASSTATTPAARLKRVLYQDSWIMKAAMQGRRVRAHVSLE